MTDFAAPAGARRSWIARVPGYVWTLLALAAGFTLVNKGMVNKGTDRNGIKLRALWDEMQLSLTARMR